MSAATRVRLRVEDEPMVERSWGHRGGHRFRLHGGRRVENVTTGEIYFECVYCGYQSQSAWGVTIHRGHTHPELRGPATPPRPKPVAAAKKTGSVLAANAPVFEQEPASAEDELTERATALLSRVYRLGFRARSAEADADEWRQRALNAEAAARALREAHHG